MSGTTLQRLVSVAPMMAYTDRHFRYLLRLLSRTTLLYTEMITAQAIAHRGPERLLAYDAAEHPVALQLGGSEPRLLAAAAGAGAQLGYDEVNLNVGCPSERVKSGSFGACLMAEPELVADCVRAMIEAVPAAVPVTVKCRIGIDEHDDYGFFARFVNAAAEAGARVFIVHARKALLTGLSPRENREIPPLRYDMPLRLKRERPDLGVVLNGGLRSVAQVQQWLPYFDGIMFGRRVCEDPWLLAELDVTLTGAAPPSRADVIAAYADYAERMIAAGHRPAALLRHAQTLFTGFPGAKGWRRRLSDHGAGVDLLRASLPALREAPDVAAVRAAAGRAARTGT